MTEYEQLLNDAIRNVIDAYGDQLKRHEINRFTKNEFRKLSNEYPMKYIQQDALTAYACELKGKPWVSYNSRKKLTQAQIEFNKTNYPRNEIDDLVDRLHTISPYQGHTVARGKRKVIR